MIVNGTTYQDNTPEAVVNALESHRDRGRNGIRIRIYYGDRETGRAWGDTEAGYIGRSMGAGPNPQRVPLVLHNATSSGGGALMTDSIVRIECANKRDGGVIYQHPSYHVAEGDEVYINR